MRGYLRVRKAALSCALLPARECDDCTPPPPEKQYLSARGSGILSLHNLGYMAEHFPETFDRLMHKRTGTRSEWEYPFAAAGVNLTFMLSGVWTGAGCAMMGALTLLCIRRNDLCAGMEIVPKVCLTLIPRPATHRHHGALQTRRAPDPEILRDSAALRRSSAR